MLQSMGSQSHTRLSNWTEQNPCSRFYHLVFGNDNKIYCCPTFILSHSNQLSCSDCFYSCDTTFIYCSMTNLLLNLMAWNHSLFICISYHSEPGIQVELSKKTHFYSVLTGALARVVQMVWDCLGHLGSPFARCYLKWLYCDWMIQDSCPYIYS